MKVSIVASNKNRQKLFVDGYDFHLRSVNKKNEQRWSCAQRKAHGCKAIVVTVDSNGRPEVVQVLENHNHPVSQFKEEVWENNNKLKDMASCTELDPVQIIDDTLATCSPEVRDHLPSKRAQKTKIWRARRSETANDATFMDYEEATSDLIPEPVCNFTSSNDSPDPKNEESSSVKIPESVFNMYHIYYEVS